MLCVCFDVSKRVRVLMMMIMMMMIRTSFFVCSLKKSKKQKRFEKKTKKKKRDDLVEIMFLFFCGSCVCRVCAFFSPLFFVAPFYSSIYFNSLLLTLTSLVIHYFAQKRYYYKALEV